MADSKPGAKFIVLAHGAWMDGSSWSEVIERLQRDGFRVMAVQTSMNSLVEDVANVRRVLSLQDGPTILAGHSFGALSSPRSGRTRRM